jgi:acetyl esterase/lipase
VRRGIPTVLLTSALCFCISFSQHKDIALERLLGLPFPTSLEAAPTGGTIALVQNAEGVHEWNMRIQTFLPAHDPHRYEEAARIAHISSPIAYVDDWRSPVLVIHSDDDRYVAFSQTVALVEQFRQRKVEVEQLIFPGEVHGFLLHQHWVQALRATAEFFERRLAK